MATSPLEARAHGRLLIGRKPSLAGRAIDTGAAGVAILLVKIGLEGM